MNCGFKVIAPMGDDYRQLVFESDNIEIGLDSEKNWKDLDINQHKYSTNPSNGVFCLSWDNENVMILGGSINITLPRVPSFDACLKLLAQK